MTWRARLRWAPLILALAVAVLCLYQQGLLGPLGAVGWFLALGLVLALVEVLGTLEAGRAARRPAGASGSPSPASPSSTGRPSSPSTS